MSNAPAFAGVQPSTPANAGAFDMKDVTPGTYDVTFRSPEFAELVKRDVKIEPGKHYRIWARSRCSRAAS